MIFKSLALKDFRGVEELTLDLHPKLTVIVGRNGAGKTSFLDGISHLLAMLRFLWPDSKGTPVQTLSSIPDQDVRKGGKDASITGVIQLDENKDEIIQAKEHSAFHSVVASPWPRYTILKDNCRFTAKERPLFAYYRQNRGFEERKHPNKKLDADTVFTESLSENLSILSDLGRWWDVRSGAEGRAAIKLRQIEHRDPELEAVRKLIETIDGFTGVDYELDFTPPGLYLSKTGNRSVEVSQLSSGERAFLILLADLARRLQTLAPNKKLSEIPGVILIDEVELNLHPTWQGKILKILINTFSKCQFIVTTHSPQVVSSVEKEHVRILDVDEYGKVTLSRPRNTKGRSSDFLLEGIFDAPERDPEVADLIDQFDDAIDDVKVEFARELLSQIENSTDGDPDILPALYSRLTKIESTQP